MCCLELICKTPTDTKPIKRIKEYTPGSMFLNIYTPIPIWNIQKIRINLKFLFSCLSLQEVSLDTLEKMQWPRDAQAEVSGITSNFLCIC